MQEKKKKKKKKKKRERETHNSHKDVIPVQDVIQSFLLLIDPMETMLVHINGHHLQQLEQTSICIYTYVLYIRTYVCLRTYGRTHNILAPSHTCTYSRTHACTHTHTHTHTKKKNRQKVNEYVP